MQRQAPTSTNREVSKYITRAQHLGERREVQQLRQRKRPLHPTMANVPRHPFERLGLNLREGLGLFLMLTMVVIIPFIIMESRNSREDFHIRPRREWREGSIIFHCSSTQCRKDNCTIYTIENHNADVVLIKVEKEMYQLVCDRRTDYVCTVWLHESYNRTDQPFWCKLPQTCENAPARGEHAEWYRQCRRNHQSLASFSYTTAEPPSTLPPFIPGMIRFQCPKDVWIKSRRVYTLFLEPLRFGQWHAVEPEDVKPQCDGEDTCSITLSAVLDDSHEEPFWCGRPRDCVTNPHRATTLNWLPACKEAQQLRDLPTRVPPFEAHNVALSMMTEFASAGNYSKCWICQHLPTSSRSPMLIPVPLTGADWAVLGWRTFIDRFAKDDEDCYIPASQIKPDEQSMSQYQGDKGEAIRFAVKTFNYKFGSANANWVSLFRLTYYKKYVLQGLRYKMQMTLAETNCKTESEWLNSGCSLIPNTASIRVDISIQHIPWANKWVETHLTWVKHNCTQPLIPNRPKNRDCTKPTSPIPVHPITNVHRCLQFRAEDGYYLGTSNCSSNMIRVFGETRNFPLPDQVYLVCGNLAYGCIPKIGTTVRKPITGSCYLAFLIPLIRRTDVKELAPAYVRHRRTISLGSRIVSILIPSYGSYISQKEIVALSSVLERHMNKTATALSAIQGELNDIRHMVLQNRMALDLILASQGGVCKVVGTECCTYISDSSSAVHDVITDTEQGIKELHEDHHWNPFGGMQAMTGFWGSSVISGLLWAGGAIFFIVLLFMLMVTLIKVCVKKTTATLVTVTCPDQPDLYPLPDWIPPYHESTDSDSFLEKSFD